MRRLLGLLAATLVVPGCGTPTEPNKQAEELHSIAAEGALLAHDAAGGATTERFTRAHAAALRERLRTLEQAIRDDRLAVLSERVDAAVDDVPRDPDRAERALEKQADAAERLAG